MQEDEPLAANPLVTARALQGLHAEAFGWAVSLCRGRRDEAADMLQWAYTEIVSGRARFDGRSTLKTWLFGVVRNLTRSYWRRQWRRLKFESAWSAPASAAIEDSDSESASTQTALLQAFAQLPTRQREVLELVFHRDLTLEQAAAVMGVSLGSARTHYERGKRRLREMLGVTQ